MSTESKHGTSVHRDIANRNTVLQGQVGSGLHGVTTSNDDRDEMGVCIEPPEFVIGNAKFEQYIYRTQPDGVRSGAGDLDLVVYSLRKWTRLTAQGNPTVLLMLFIPPAELVKQTAIGADIQAHPERFLSRQMADRFAGYLVAQRERMLGMRSQRTNRPELVGIFGFDTKFAYHMVRLGLQGVELLTEGRITLPIPEPDRSWLRELREGKHTKAEALERSDELLAQLNTLRGTADLPETPDYRQLDRWLVRTYQQHWEDRD